MSKILHIDIETYSSIDIKLNGAYKYFDSIDFEILMIAYAWGSDPVEILDLSRSEIPDWFISALLSPEVEKHAHNANFERNAFKTYGIDVPADQWFCSAVKSAYCGLPLSLGEVSKVLNLGGLGKSSEGLALIKYFSCPVKPTKTNGMRTRNYPEHDPEKWEKFKVYCMQDVEAERAIGDHLSRYKIPVTERLNYVLDQKINDRGVLIDTVLAEQAVKFNDTNVAELKIRATEITGLEKPNSPPQLKKWLSDRLKINVTTLTKDTVKQLITDCETLKGFGDVEELLGIRQKMAKTSIQKYVSMLACACEDLRVRGIHQFYGAGRTGRWAGRLVQPQNMPKNLIDYLDEARAVVRSGNYDLATLLYDQISNILSQLTRTAIIAPEGKTLAVADFSAIEARVIAWLSGEVWRLDVFASHGKIYEASASKMFSVPIESVTKDSDYRAKGKVAELALGYQGSVGALKTMGGEAMGLSESEMKIIVKRWRLANQKIVSLWTDLEKCAIASVQHKKKVVSVNKGITFETNDEFLTIKLPSGRRLFYYQPELKKETIKFDGNEWDKVGLSYMGVDSETKQWTRLKTYGGKITENVVQAIARDLLADAMREMDQRGIDIVMHVHDEAAAETFIDEAEATLELMCDIMSKGLPWAEGLPLGAEGYITAYYKKE